MAENKGFAEIAQRMGLRGTSEKGPPHDQVVLIASTKALAIGLVRGFLEPKLARKVWTELEYAITDRDFADVAVFEGDRLAFLMEIKSEAEAQTASGWTRQVKRYENLSGVPVILVVAHDLGDVQSKYLSAANVRLLDLRGGL